MQRPENPDLQKSKTFLVPNILDKEYLTCSRVLVRKRHAATGAPCIGFAQWEAGALRVSP